MRKLCLLKLMCIIINLITKLTLGKNLGLHYMCGLTNLSRQLTSNRQSQQQRKDVTLEIGVFYDDHFHHKYQSVLDDFVRTLFRQAQMVFDLPSLEHRVHLVVKLVERIPSSEMRCDLQKPAQSYADQNCCGSVFGRWQNKAYPYKDGKRMYDLAIFLTPKNLLSSNLTGRGSLGGSTWRDEACNPKEYNTALVCVNGLHSAYSLAHEIAHSIGAQDDIFLYPEDGKKLTCEQGVMGYGDHNMFLWSNCTNKRMTWFLQSNLAHCLFNKPDRYIWDFSNRDRFTPADRYDYNRQCQLLYGPEYRRDDNYLAEEEHMPGYLEFVCQKIVCYHDAFRLTPPFNPLLLEGTDCKYRNRFGKCKLGKCVF